MENVKTIKAILRSFELVSGLKINFAKSCFGAFGQSDLWKQQAANYLNCRLLTLPFTYLGIPIGANPRRCRMWDSIIHKCERKLAKWKQRHISFGGRLTLIQSVLTSIPIYFFSFFRVPKSVVDKLVRIQRRFLWGGGPDQNKIAWISWEAVCLPKKKGGLTIVPFFLFPTPSTLLSSSLNSQSLSHNTLNSSPFLSHFFVTFPLLFSRQII